MHEAGMVDRILEVVLARAAEAGASRITRIHLEAGPLSGVSDEALRFHWAEHAAGTAAEGATLVVDPTDDLVELRLVSIDVDGDEGEPGAS
jgi:Zn finger protein HypA/HybF involved in hydrogenase expression